MIRMDATDLTVLLERAGKVPNDLLTTATEGFRREIERLKREAEQRPDSALQRAETALLAARTLGNRLAVFRAAIESSMLSAPVKKTLIQMADDLRDGKQPPGGPFKKVYPALYRRTK